MLHQADVKEREKLILAIYIIIYVQNFKIVRYFLLEKRGRIVGGSIVGGSIVGG